RRTAQQAQEQVLGEVLRPVPIPAQAVEELHQLLPVCLEQLLEGVRVPVPVAREQVVAVPCRVGRRLARGLPEGDGSSHGAPSDHRDVGVFPAPSWLRCRPASSPTAPALCRSARLPSSLPCRRGSSAGPTASAGRRSATLYAHSTAVTPLRSAR